MFYIERYYVLRNERGKGARAFLENTFLFRKIVLNNIMGIGTYLIN